VRECAALEVQVTEDLQAHTHMMNGRRCRRPSSLVVRSSPSPLGALRRLRVCAVRGCGARSPPCSAQRPPDAVSIAALAAGTSKT
jgi:hypothetical protein